MKKILCTLFIFLTLPIFTEEALKEVDPNLLSETLGHLIVRQLDNPGITFNLEKVIEGIRNEQKGLPAPMSEEEYEQAIYALQEQLFLQAAEQNLSKANTFLQENSSKEGVEGVDPKLQYKITQEGNGESVGPESIPLIHYKGSLIDGTVFASSDEIGEPVALPIKQSIPGFAKGLVGMKEGEKRTLYIHPEDAYGLSANLPPNSLLIFEVEVVKANSISYEEIAQIQEVKESDSPR